jgi:hypothetical protein
MIKIFIILKSTGFNSYQALFSMQFLTKNYKFFVKESRSGYLCGNE